MSFDLAILLGIVAAFFVFMGIEALAPSGRAMPVVRRWRLIGTAGFLTTMSVSVFSPLLIVPLLPERMAIADTSGWGSWGFLPVWVGATFAGYWFHRTMHYFDLLWRAGHQVHHSVVRLDMGSAMIFHPVDFVVIGVLGGLLSAGLLGASAQAAGWAGLWGTLVGYYQHWNIRTPAWTGWFIQRPEQHMLHHEKDVHARNFGDMPLWDRLFGTYAAPEDREIALGFEPERARRWLAMTAMADVNKAVGPAKGRISL